MATAVSKESAFEAISVWRESPESEDLLAQATRKSLQWFAQQFPGQAVEIRVPPYKAIQVLGGTAHRRGTPPAVVEMTAHTWLDLLLGNTQWDRACFEGLVQASGERSDLTPLFEQINN